MSGVERLCPAGRRRLPEIFTYSGAEDAVDDWVGSGVKRRHALDESGQLDHLRRVGNHAVHLAQVEDEVGTPAHDKH